jgi:FtsZ-interacting cell division protein ZipA
MATGDRQHINLSEVKFGGRGRKYGDESSRTESSFQTDTTNRTYSDSSRDSRDGSVSLNPTGSKRYRRTSTRPSVMMIIMMMRSLLIIMATTLLTCLFCPVCTWWSLTSSSRTESSFQTDTTNRTYSDSSRDSRDGSVSLNPTGSKRYRRNEREGSIRRSRSRSMTSSQISLSLLFR